MFLLQLRSGLERSSDVLANVARRKKFYAPKSGENNQIYEKRSMGPQVRIGTSKLQPPKPPSTSKGRGYPPPPFFLRSSHSSGV